jgi:hypothetical protein
MINRKLDQQRYMPQNIFDALVVADLIGRVANPQDDNHVLDGLIERYLRAYPSEERGQLKADIFTAAHLSASIIDDIDALFGGIDDPGRRAHVVAVLEQVLNNVTNSARARKPALQRIFGGTFFNHETRPQVDRVRLSGPTIAKAALVVCAGQPRQRSD